MHYALVPSHDRTALLMVDGALPAVTSKRLRTPLVSDTLEREIGLRAPFLRTSAVVATRTAGRGRRCSSSTHHARRRADRGSRSTRRPGWSRPSYGTPPSSGRWPEAAPQLREIHETWSSRSEEILGLGAVDRRLDTLEVPPELSGRLDALRDLLMFGSDEDRPPLLEAYGVAPEVFELAAPVARIHHAISYERILEAMEPSDRWIFAEVPRQLREAGAQRLSAKRTSGGGLGGTGRFPRR